MQIKISNMAATIMQNVNELEDPDNIIRKL